MLNNIMKFTINYWGSILVVLLSILALLFLYRRSQKETVKQIILALVVQAEKTSGSGAGELKDVYVIKELYPRVPRIFRIFISKKEIDRIIENSVTYLKGCLSTNKDLLANVSEEK